MTLNSPATLQKRNAARAHWKATVDPTSVKPFRLGRCVACGKRKRRRWASTFTQTGEPEYRSRCVACDRAFMRGQAARVRTKTSHRAKAKRAVRKAECVAYLGGACHKCGYSKSVHALTFHHKSRSNKTRDVSAMLDYSWARLVAELDRCVLVCFNCHMELEEAYRAKL